MDTMEMHAKAGSSTPLDRLRPLIGRTPLLEIRVRQRGRAGRIFAKYESLNFTGSIKDRMAACILEQAYVEGAIRPGDEILEASGGNTAISFAAMGRALGHPVRIFMPDWMSTERVALLRTFGATLVAVPVHEGGFAGSIERARRFAEEHPCVFEPRQFETPWNARAHAATTAVEVLAQLRSAGLMPDAAVAGVGTGGTVMGLLAGLRQDGSEIRVHPLEPAESPILSNGGEIGRHRIQGIGDEFMPRMVDLTSLAEPVAVHDGDAILMAQRLARELGLGVGISSGANLLGALALLDRYGPDAVVVTVFPDSHKKYLSTDLFREEPIRDGYLSPWVELLDFRAIPCPAGTEGG